MTNNDRGQSLITKYVWVIETIHKAGDISFNQHLILQQEILWNGEDMEVLKPIWLREEIAKTIKQMWNKYNI